MAASRIPNVGTRVNLQMFAGDLLNHRGIVKFCGLKVLA
jgi:hypothetical protein